MGSGPIDNFAWSEWFISRGRFFRIDYYWGHNDCYRGTATNANF